MCMVFIFKQKTAYEMRISDWSSDVCSSDLHLGGYMKKFARSGRIIAALVLGTSLTITASPAAFAKKKKTQTPDFTLSVAFRSAAREIQTALDAGDTATANARIESRTEERRVGEEWGRKWRSRGAPWY